MNVSSLIITTTQGFVEKVIQQIKQEKLCEYHAHKEGKIVVTIEGESVRDEIKIMKQLTQMQHVLSVEMIYSYCKDELEQEREKLEIEGNIPGWLNDENAGAEEVVYNGRVKI